MKFKEYIITLSSLIIIAILGFIPLSSLITNYLGEEPSVDEGLENDAFDYSSFKEFLEISTRNGSVNNSAHYGSWTVYWDEECHLNMTQNRDVFNHIYPYWYTLDSFAKVVQTVDEPGFIWNRLNTYRELNYTVIPIIYCGNNATYTLFFNDLDLRAKHIERICKIVNNTGYDGIEINYESVRYSDRYRYVSFIENLSVEMKKINKTISVSLYPRWTDDRTGFQCDAYIYEPIGVVADQVKIMAYNEHWSTHHSAGAVASYDWVHSIMEYAVTKIPREKVILGIPTFGYDWPVDEVGNTLSGAQIYNYEQAENVREVYGVKRQWNATGRYPFYTYNADYGSNRYRETHYSDNQSFLYKLYLVKKFNLYGLCFWYMGHHDGKINTHLRKYIASNATNLPPSVNIGKSVFAEPGKPIRFNDAIAYDVDGTIKNIRWDFGDGNESNKLYAEHAYEKQGIYQVTLTAEDNDGCIDRHHTQVKVVPCPVIDSMDEVNEDSPIQFDASETYDRDGIITYTWDFGDGNVDYHAGSAVTHIYEDPGNYTVRLTIINKTGFTTYTTKRVWVHDLTPPRADIPSENHIRKGYILTLDASGSTDNGLISRYEWNFGDGTFEITTVSWVNHIYNKMGTYFVDLAVYDSEGNYNVDTGAVFVKDGTPPVVIVDYPEKVQLGGYAFLNATASYDNENITFYNWSLGDGSIIFGSNRSILNYRYDQPGTYYITLQILDAMENWNTTTFHLEVTDVILPIAVMNLSILDDKNLTNYHEYRISYSDGNRTQICYSLGELVSFEDDFNITRLRNFTYRTPSEEDNRSLLPYFISRVNNSLFFNFTNCTDNYGLSNLECEMGDGVIIKNSSFYYIYQYPGIYFAVLRIRDLAGNEESIQVPILIFEPSENKTVVNETEDEDLDGLDDRKTYSSRSILSKNKSKLLWIVFVLLVIGIVIYDLSISVKGMRVEEDMDVGSSSPSVNKTVKSKNGSPSDKSKAKGKDDEDGSQEL